MNEKIISVIIPVYNIEKYIEKCITSVINQTYEKLQIILIDDGSTDKSGLICDEFAARDDRIIVIHKENGGLSSARNAGLDIARGEYIGFVDGDDYIDKGMYEYLYNLVINYGADISICGYVSVENGHYSNSNNNHKKDVRVYKGQEKYNLITGLKTIDIVAWNKLFKKKVFDYVRFETKRLHEDQWTMPYVVHNSDVIVKGEEEYYFYINRDDSITGKKVSPKRMWDLLDSLRNTSLFFKQNNLFPAQKEEVRHLCNYILFYYKRANIDFDNPKEIKKQLKELFDSVFKENKNVLSYKQVIYNVFRIFPWLGIIIKDIYH